MSTQGSSKPFFVAAKFKNAEAEGQWRKCRSHAHVLAMELGYLNRYFAEGWLAWEYRAPASDNPEDWEGMLRWCAVEREYVWLLDRAASLHGGAGPFYCGTHQRRPGAGWVKRDCLRCSWAGYLYDETLAMARALGRQQRKAA